jgi:2-C-methyl-D-erythritol 4-phosphate cytidylyltransferase
VTAGVWTVVVAAGQGRRFGGPKLYARGGEAGVLDRSLASARLVSEGVVLVVAPERAADPEPAASAVVVGGATRSESVRRGLAAVPADAEVIVIHDAARPYAEAELFRAVVAAVRAGADGAVPGLPLTDTVKQVTADGTVRTTLDRATLVTVQTPQAFRAAVLRAAHAPGGDATDDAALVEQAGGRVVVVPGHADNRKITVAADLST